MRLSYIPVNYEYFAALESMESKDNYFIHGSVFNYFGYYKAGTRFLHHPK